MCNDPVINNLTHRHVDTSPSTNSELISAIQQGEIDTSACYLLTANLQTAGRGQHGRTWQSPQGNVYLSLYHPIDVPICGLLSLIVGYYLTQIPTINQINRYRSENDHPRIGVKWANDIGFYDTLKVDNSNTVMFNKLAGILIEPVLVDQHLQGVVIGVGLNVATTPHLTQSMQESLPYRAISLADLNKHTPSLNDIYLQITQSLSQAMHSFISIQKNKTSDLFSKDGFIKAFAKVDVLANKKVRIISQYPSPFVTEGIAVGLDKHGCLLVRQRNAKIVPIFAGNVQVVV